MGCQGGDFNGAHVVIVDETKVLVFELSCVLRGKEERLVSLYRDEQNADRETMRPGLAGFGNGEPEGWVGDGFGGVVSDFEGLDSDEVGEWIGVVAVVEGLFAVE